MNTTTIFKIYGRPKLIEFDKMKSPFFTCRDFKTPSGIIFSAVFVIYIESADVSPIFIQLIPLGSFVINLFIGRGDPPRSIMHTSPNFTVGHLLILCKPSSSDKPCWISASKRFYFSENLRCRRVFFADVLYLLIFVY